MTLGASRGWLTCLSGAVLASAAAISLGAAPRQRADRVFLNGNVWTGDAARPRAQALAVRGPTLLAVGTNAEVRKTAEKLTEVVDLRGRFVVPGFNDAHLHFLAVKGLELDGAETLEEVRSRLSAYARAHPDEPWITGRGWGHAAFPGAAPNKTHLDAVVADRAVLLVDRDGHSALANSVALAVAGITRLAKDPPNGVIVRDANGDPTGLLKEAAVGLVGRLVPRPSEEERYQTLVRLLDRAASHGLTSVQNASFPGDDWPVYERVRQERGLKVRFSFAVPFREGATATELAEYKGLRHRHRGPLVKFGAAKGTLDGTVDARTAAFLEPYRGGGTGLPMWTQEALNEAAALYDREGIQIQLHAVGDRAIRMALDAFEHAARVNGTSGRRHRIEHAEVPHPADLPRFKALGVVASTQARFANPDRTTLENYAVLLGPERTSRANAFARFDEAGVVQAFGSDWPVFPMEPLKGLYCAVARMTPEGTPPGGWHPENRISAEAALRHFTADAAFANFDEGVKGTLVPGKLADFVVLSEDVLKPPAERLLKARVLLTVLGGRDTFRSESF